MFHCSKIKNFSSKHCIQKFRMIKYVLFQHIRQFILPGRSVRFFHGPLLLFQTSNFFFDIAVIVKPLSTRLLELKVPLEVYIFLCLIIWEYLWLDHKGTDRERSIYPISKMKPNLKKSRKFSSASNIWSNYIFFPQSKSNKNWLGCLEKVNIILY